MGRHRREDSVGGHGAVGASASPSSLPPSFSLRSSSTAATPASIIHRFSSATRRFASLLACPRPRRPRVYLLASLASPPRPQALRSLPLPGELPLRGSSLAMCSCRARRWEASLHANEFGPPSGSPTRPLRRVRRHVRSQTAFLHLFRLDDQRSLLTVVGEVFVDHFERALSLS